MLYQHVRLFTCVLVACEGTGHAPVSAISNGVLTPKESDIAQNVCDIEDLLLK